MSTEAANSPFGGPSFEPRVVCREVSLWYDKVIALNGISFEVGHGVIGLLGPNGAGKSSLMRILVGLFPPSSGQVQVCGEDTYIGAKVRGQIGYCPEHDFFYEDMSGLDFVALMTELYGFSRGDARQRAASALDRVGLASNEVASHKRIRDYSMGMRQKVKLAQALAHDPKVIVLDEPLTGTDPVSRRQISDVCRQLGNEGRTVFVSSHVLHEVERMTQQFLLIDRGRLLASGNVHDIRALIDQHPHRVEFTVSEPRALAAILAQQSFVTGLTIVSDCTLVCETSAPDACYAAIPQLARESGTVIRKMTSPDNNLEAVFRYLTR